MAGYVLAVRPQPGLAATIATAEKMGLNAIGYPLFEIVAQGWTCPDPSQIDGLLIGSANAFRHSGAQLGQLKSKPVYAVGETTAKVAREMGFEVAKAGTGGLQNLVDELGSIDPKLHLLRLAGARSVPLDPPQGLRISTEIVYEAKPLELPEPLRPLHDLGLTVLLHSAAAAEQFDKESRRLALERTRIKLVVIGPRVAESAGSGWHTVHVCERPSDRAMLELAAQMCI